MKSLSRLALILFVLFVVATAASPTSAATLYSVTAVASATSNAYGINVDGDVTGVFRTGSGADHAFLYTQASGFLDLGTLAGGNSVGRAINDNGQVVGQSDGIAFRYKPGTGMVALSTGPSDARGIENGNNVIGTRYGSSDQTTIWSPTNVSGSVFVTDSTEGYAINGLGEIVGRVDSSTSGYYSDGGSNSTFTDLGFFLPNDINNIHRVVGSQNGEAALYDAGLNTYLPIGKLNPTDSLSDALAINSLNQVVGVSEGTGGFSWTQAGGMRDLNQLLASGFGSWTILSANGVNNNGWITGLGELGGQQFAVILTPVPEPATISLLSSGAVALAVVVRRRVLRSSRGERGWPRADSRLRRMAIRVVSHLTSQRSVPFHARERLHKGKLVGHVYGESL